MVKNRYPYFVYDRGIILTEATLILKPKDGEVLNIDDLELTLNTNTESGEWI